MTNYYECLKNRIAAREVAVGIIGLGYVGLPLVRHFVLAGIRVIAVDTDAIKIEHLSRGENYLRHVPLDWVPPVIEKGLLYPSQDYQALKEADAILICVPTPLTKHREPDLSYIYAAIQGMRPYLQKGVLVSLESTTYPGTTAEVVLPALMGKGWRAGEEFFLVFSPEREDPGNLQFSIKNIPKVIGGVTPQCSELASALYGIVFERTVIVSSPAAAELCKLLENIFRSVNIALVNEMKLLCDRMNLDIWEIIEAAATKPFGYMPFYPGPGLGGHCIPIDPFYLTWKAREYDFTTRFIELSGEINTSMPYYVVSRVIEALNQHGKALKGASILILGAAYKKDVDDIRESPSLLLISLLEKGGAQVCYHDPYVPCLSGSECNTSKESVPLTPEVLADCDVVLIATAHSCFDAEFILEHAPLVVDTRNLTGKALRNRHKIVKA